jgi:glycosyltransferase involved in cell wall biosynthesis
MLVSGFGSLLFLLGELKSFMNQKPCLAVLIPTYNEEVAIAKVVRDFQRVLPQAIIHVFDNNSSDGTVAIARSLGAVVRHVPLQGKGNVMRRMFADIEADVYILVDGDDTYHAESSLKMIDKLLGEGLDMVVGRRESVEVASYRAGHRLGNQLLTGCVAYMFGRRFTDMLSGYRVFSRRYVKSFPALAQGFETETELTVHALELRMPVAEVNTPYKSRPEGSFSKLHTIRDGVRILSTILRLFRLERPVLFYGLIGAVLALLAMGISVPLAVTYAQTGLVPRLPTAVLATGLGILASLSVTSGLILENVTQSRQEARRLVYLGISSCASTFPNSATLTEDRA